MCPVVRAGISGDEGWWGIQATGLAVRPAVRNAHDQRQSDRSVLPDSGRARARAGCRRRFCCCAPCRRSSTCWRCRSASGSCAGCTAAPTAWIQTVALAIMPTAIAHSRICQDPSQSVFWTSVVIFLCLLGFEERGGPGCTGVAALAALPGRRSGRIRRTSSSRRSCCCRSSAAVRPLLPTSRTRDAPSASRRSAVVVVIGTAVAAWPALERICQASNQYLDQPWLSMAAARLIDGRQWFEFAANNARLFNGVTIYHYFFRRTAAGTVPYDAGFVLVVVAALWRISRAPPRPDAIATGLSALIAGVRRDVDRVLRGRRSRGAASTLRALGTVPHRARHAGSGARV